MSFTRTLNHTAFVAALALAASVSASAQVAHLTLQSQPGDFIGQGQNYDFTFNPATTPGDQITTFILPPKTGTAPDYARFVLDKDDGASRHPFLFGFLDFSTSALGIPLTPGTYAGAQRAGFAATGHPGLDVEMDGRGSNTLTGNFSVTDFTYSAVTAFGSTSYTIDTFAATFEQHSEGHTPALFGQFSYYADGFAPVPEASTTVSFGLLLALGAGGAVIAARKKKAAA